MSPTVRGTVALSSFRGDTFSESGAESTERVLLLPLRRGEGAESGGHREGNTRAETEHNLEGGGAKGSSIMNESWGVSCTLHLIELFLYFVILYLDRFVQLFVVGLTHRAYLSKKKGGQEEVGEYPIIKRSE